MVTVAAWFSAEGASNVCQLETTSSGYFARLTFFLRPHRQRTT
jgi:hypothetical protein